MALKLTLLKGSVAIGLVTLMLVMGLGLWIGAWAIKGLWRPCAPVKFHRLSAAHQHDAHCGCGYAHVPSAQQVASAVSVKTQLLLVASMGLRLVRAPS